jgi:transglutaminase-like putative cysteine protease
MIFDIAHTTTYLYNRPVFLEPQILRFRPRSDGRQLLRSFQLALSPQPAGQTELIDAEGNAVTRAWFNGLTESFSVAARFTVETGGDNPFDYLPEPNAKKLPMVYAEDTRVHLVPYLRRMETDDSLRRLAGQITRESSTNGDALAFLHNLNDWIYCNCRNTSREHSGPHRAEQTLADREGSCRDVAVLFMETCRAVGLAARFVSGYQQGDTDQARRELHAWAEVYVPGGGWRGYDPTHGLAVADRHIAVATSAIQRATMPVTGSFRGTGATAKMETHIELTARARS